MVPKSLIAQIAVVDPGFTREGGRYKPQIGGTNLLFDNFFSQNCMKMKKFWWWRERLSQHPSPPDPPMLRSAHTDIQY